MTFSITIAMILFMCAAFSFYLAVSELVQRRKNRNSRLFACYACSSSWWSLCFGALHIQGDVHAAYIWRNIGMAAVFLYMILAAFMVVRFIEPPRWLGRVITGFSFLGIFVFPVTILPDSAVFQPVKGGMTYELSANWANHIYSTFTVILMVLFLGSMSYMLIKHKKKGKKVQDLCMIGAGVVLAFGTFLDTIMPMLGFKAFPGSSIGQFLGVVVIYGVLCFSIRSRLTAENMSKYIYYSLGTPIYICDETLQLQVVNKAGYQFLDLGEAECLQLNMQEIFDMDRESLKQEQVHLPEAECLINHSICNVNINRIMDYFGDLLGYILIADDLSDKIRYMEELDESRKQAEAANAAKSMFLANMSHEIRTPMHAIVGFSELILNQEISDEVQRNVGYIRESAYNLLSIINDILDFSKIESGRTEIQEVPYFASSLLRDAVNIISNQAETKGLRFEVELDNNIPRKLYGDKIRIRSVLINILNNAIKYTEAGSVRLSICCSKVAEDQVEGVFTVTDTGIGMHQEDISQLFQAFERLDKKIHYGVEGSGLGLAICNSYIELMGGKIEVESVYGEGSTFRVILRQKVLEWEPMDKEFVYHDMPDGKKMHIRNQKILVVDDHLINRLVAEGILSAYGGQVDMADGGKAAIEACKQEEYQLIFMDQMMPEINGTMALKEIRKISPYYSKEAAIIVLTADAIAGMREHFLAEGFDEYLSKPIEVAKLERVLRRFVPEDCIYYE